MRSFALLLAFILDRFAQLLAQPLDASQAFPFSVMDLDQSGTDSYRNCGHITLGSGHLYLQAARAVARSLVDTIS